MTTYYHHGKKLSKGYFEPYFTTKFSMESIYRAFKEFYGEEVCDSCLQSVRAFGVLYITSKSGNIVRIREQSKTGQYRK